MEFWGILIITIIIITVITIIVNLYEKKRTEKLLAIAQSLNMSFEPKDQEKLLLNYLKGFRVTALGRGRKAYNIFSGDSKELKVTIFDYRYTVGGGKSSNTYNQTITLFESEKFNLPQFRMKPENVFHRIGNTFGAQDIDFEDYPVFSKQYLLQGDDEMAIRNCFDHKKLTLFTENKGFSVEGHQNRLLVYKHGKRSAPEEIQNLLQQHLAIANSFTQ